MPHLSGLPCDPADLISRWPPDRLLALVRRPAEDGAQWTIFGICDEAAIRMSDEPQVRSDPVAAINRLMPITSSPPAVAETAADPAALPFRSGWMLSAGYELGRMLEPAARDAHAERPPVPVLTLLRCCGALLHRAPDSGASSAQGQAGSWHTAGHVPAELLARLTDPASTAPPSAFSTGVRTWSLDDDAYLRAVQRILELIAAGDAYQVNLTRKLTCTFTGSARHLAAAALRSAAPRHGAVIETPDARTIISMSPELFLDVCPARRRIVTRPIKGTRPSEESTEALRTSVKETAELTMIVDLMRNDLGRICAAGSVRVSRPRYIETHGTVHHGVAEISGTLRRGIGPGEMLAAAFAPGSVTGAPRIRAMQIIEELEPDGRGAYCGAIGFMGDHGAASLNVAIRTIELTGLRRADACDLTHGILRYGTGGGIVADSCPQAELEETRQKTRVLDAALAAADASPPPIPQPGAGLWNVPCPAGPPR